MMCKPARTVPHMHTLAILTMGCSAHTPQAAERLHTDSTLPASQPPRDIFPARVGWSLLTPHLDNSSATGGNTMHGPKPGSQLPCYC
jgi:hypothetical protein